ncbi:MAG: hypothetical protein U0325_03950 [Polyangiales bacterium]
MRVWRVVVHPERSHDVAVTVVDPPGGARVELRGLSGLARVHVDHDLGRPVPPASAPPTPHAWVVPRPADVIEAIAAQWDALPPSDETPARWFGTTLVTESRDARGLGRRVAWWPSAQGRAAHDPWSRALFSLAPRTFAEPRAQAALDPPELRPAP